MARREPKPYVYAYKVGRVQYQVVDGTMIPMWADTKAIIVGPDDIERVLKEPNTFMLGWQECHFELIEASVKDRIIERHAEYFITKDHPVNLSLLDEMSKSFEAALSDEFTVKIPKFESYEAILFNLGWQFNWSSVGEEPILGSIIPPEIHEQALQNPLIKKLMSRPSDVQPVQVGQKPVVPQPQQPVSAPASDTRLDVLESMVAQLTSLVQTLVTSNAPAVHPEPSVKLRTVRDEREENDLDHHLHAGPAIRHGLEFRDPVS